MRIPSFLLALITLMSFAAVAVATPGIDVELKSVAYSPVGNGNIVFESVGLGSFFADPNSCSGAPNGQTTLVAVQTTNLNFKQIFALALAALLDDKLVDVIVSQTGSMATDCDGLYPIVIGITTKK